MADRLSWVFELLDKVSGPASKAAAALEKIEKKMRQATATSDKLGKTFVDAAGRMRFANGRFVGAGGLFGGGGGGGLFGGAFSGSFLGTFAGQVGAIVGRVGVEVPLAFGRAALAAASFGEDTRISLTNVLGSTSEANKAMRSWGRFAAVSPFETSDIFKWGLALRMAGRDAKDTDLLLKTVGDIGLLTGQKSPENAAYATQLFNRLLSGEHLSQEMLNSFTIMGVQTDKVLKNLGARMGTTTEGARAMMRNGMVPGMQAVQALIDASEQASGSRVGGLTEKMSHTLSGEFSTLKSFLTFDMFQGLEKSQGYKTLRSVLQTINNTLNPDTQTGKAVMGSITGLADHLGKMLEPMKDPETVKKFFQTFVEGAKEALEGLGYLASAAVTTMRFLKSTGEMTGNAAGALSVLFDGAAGTAEKHEAAKFLMEGVLGMEAPPDTAMSSLAPGAVARSWRAIGRADLDAPSSRSTMVVNVDARGSGDPAAVRLAAENGIRGALKLRGQ